LKGPAYDTKAADYKTSPTITLAYSSQMMIEFFHLSFSEAKAVTNLYARFNLNAHLSASAIAAFFSPSALSKSALRTAKAAFNLATYSSTSFNLIVAASNYSNDSLRAILFGCTY
jgi:hypothetical protein